MQEDASKEPDRLFWIVVALASLVGLVVRYVFVEWIAPDIYPMSDAAGYHYLGKFLAEGRGYINWGNMVHSGVANSTAEFAPLFPGLIALLCFMGVTEVGDQQLALSILGTVNIPLIALFGRAVGGDLAGKISAVLAIVSPGLLEIGGSMMTEVLYVPLVTLVFLSLCVARRRPTSGRWAIVGIAIGLSALTRSEGILFFPLLAFPLVWSCPRNRRIPCVLALTVGLTAMVLPWTIRNAVVFDSFIPISQNYKGVLLGANCDHAYNSVRYLGSWSLGCVHQIDRDTFTESQYFEVASEVGRRYALEHRDQWPEVIGARLQRTWGFYLGGSWSGWGTTEIRNPLFADRAHLIGWILLACVPAGLPLLRSRAEVWLLASPFLVTSLTTALAYGSPRFRAAAEPALIVLAALMIAEGWSVLRARMRDK